MAQRTCLNCVYARCDPWEWLRCLARGETLCVQCANHPHWPGQLHDIPGVPCRNYQPRPANPNGDIRWIVLADGHYALVDAADYDWLNQWNWHLCNGYPGRQNRGKVILMHRLITQAPKGMVVDHVDSNKTNNCRCNLRVCTRQENMRNARKQVCASSIYKGVTFRKEQRKWLAVCKGEDKPRRLGYFDDEAEAARAYDRAAVAWFKEFARLNFPQEWPPERRAELYAQAKEPEGGDKQSSPHTETQSHRDKKGKDQKRPGTAKETKRKTGDAPRKTKKKAISRAETQGRREGKRKTTKKPAAGGAPPK